MFPPIKVQDSLLLSQYAKKYGGFRKVDPFVGNSLTTKTSITGPDTMQEYDSVNAYININQIMTATRRVVHSEIYQTVRSENHK